MHDNTRYITYGNKSIRIKNILSFDDVYIDSFEDFNLIIGRNNSGKSNLLKVFKYFFYEKIRRTTEHSSYSKFELHALWNNNNYIWYNPDKEIVTSTNNNSRFHKHIYNTLLKNQIKINSPHFSHPKEKNKIANIP